jgi:molybdenum cofactor synthesis domain-containing protein
MSDMPQPRIAVVTVSDGVSAGTREDTTGVSIVDWVRSRRSVLVEHVVVADDRARIREALERLVDDERADVVITTGGTGLTAHDVTPEATLDVLHREAPGVAERIRHGGYAKTPYAALSRGVAGTRGSALIVNLPGGPGGVRDGLAVLDEIVDHAVQLLRGVDTHRHDPAGQHAAGDGNG